MPNLEEIMGNMSIANLWENMNIYEHHSSINGLYMNILRFCDTLNNVFTYLKAGKIENTALSNFLWFTSS